MVNLVIDNRACLSPINRVPESVLVAILDRLTFPNPAFEEAERLGFSTFNSNYSGTPPMEPQLTGK